MAHLNNCEMAQLKRHSCLTGLVECGTGVMWLLKCHIELEREHSPSGLDHSFSLLQDLTRDRQMAQHRVGFISGPTEQRPKAFLFGLNLGTKSMQYTLKHLQIYNFL